jgi:hypothetical protein
MSTERQTLQVSVLPYRCSICPHLVTQQMSNLAVLANFNTQNALLFPVHAMFRHDCPLAVKPASTPQRLVHKNTWRDSLPIDMLLSAVSVLVIVQHSSEIPEGLTNYPVFYHELHFIKIHTNVYTPLLTMFLSEDGPHTVEACHRLYRYLLYSFIPLGDFPGSEFYVPTFRNTLSIPSLQGV